MVNPSRHARVMIVDDTTQDLELLASMLVEQGYDVRPFTDGRLAVRAATEDPPSLILADCAMTRLDGFEICQRLKQIDRVREVPVILLLSDDTTDKIRAFDVGAADYINKPFNRDEVHARVRTHVALQRARFELRANYERLQAVEDLRHDLVRMVVHDMRSPLTVLLGQLDFARAEAETASAEGVLEPLDDAIQAAEFLKHLANDLLDVSRLEVGQMPIVRSACDLTKLANHVCATMTRWHPTRDIELDASGPVDVVCDERLIYRVMENLVNNAIKHTPSGSRIQISVTSSSGRVRVAVADNGPGVPREARRRIFDKFTSFSSRTQSEHSSGLGLAFCKLAVEAHRGVIGVDDSDSGGSEFWFEIPNLL